MSTSSPHLELGLFLPNTRGGTILSVGTPPQRMPSFAVNKAVTLMAESAGFEFALSQSKWRGYGGEAEHWDYSLESFTLTAALAAVTSRIRLFASVGVRTIHPAIAAKMAVTIDDVSGGRFGLNIVAGWNQAEYGQMGLWAEDDYHQYRYAYAEEYLAALNALWAPGHADFEGRFFKLTDCKSAPKPSRKLPIVCAGQSGDALSFVARHADFSFVGRQADTPEKLSEITGNLGAMASAEGRSVGAYMLITVMARATEAEAHAERDGYIATADRAGMEEWMRVSGLDPNRANYADFHSAQRTFTGMPYVAGSYEQVAAYLDSVAGAGIRGACLVFPDFEPDLARFIENVVPRMRSRSMTAAAPLA